MASSVLSMSVSVILAVGLGLAAVPRAGARAIGFLRATSVAQQDSPDALLDELETALGQGHRVGAESRVQELEMLLLPTFRSLPKLPGDRLDVGATRYMLHRHFVLRRNWNIHAFASGGDAWNSSSPSAVLRHHIGGGEAAADVFERRLVDSRGLTLREAAMLAATLESLVHEELLERLQVALRVTGLKSETALKDRDVELLMAAYMVLYLSRSSASATAKEVSDRLARFKTNPYWDPTRKWLREVRREVVMALPPDAEKNSFVSVAQQLEEASYRYGHYADQECTDLKTELLQYEGSMPGYVPLNKFYGAALHNGSWQFSESQAFLRQSGALDESDPERPSVIIPNWIGLPSNCVAGSKFYSVCCVNECDSLLGKLEQRIAAPEASPASIVELVEQLPSATVVAPRTLPEELIRRLHSIAARHGGRVPLHGRLFYQWLHNAFPRECPFPHLAGATEPLEMNAFEEKTGEKASLEREELAAKLQELESTGFHLSQSSLEVEAAALSQRWSEEEELLVMMHGVSLVEPAHASTLRGAALLFIAVSMMGAMLQTASSARSAASRWSGFVEKPTKMASVLN